MTPTYSLQCFQNEYLPEGGDEVNAIVTISAQGTGEGDGRAASDAPGAEVIMIDVSGSMEGAKIRQARDATMAAVDCIRDGVAFAVVAGNHDAALIYPWGGLAAASKDTREQAAKAVRKLTAGGGTAIGTWIACATDLLRAQSGVRHAILLTDGKDEHERAGRPRRGRRKRGRRLPV